MKDKIIKLLKNEFGKIYCDSCSGEHCEDCNRKEMGWEISEAKADELAEEIISMLSDAK